MAELLANWFFDPYRPVMPWMAWMPKARMVTTKLPIITTVRAAIMLVSTTRRLTRRAAAMPTIIVAPYWMPARIVQGGSLDHSALSVAKLGETSTSQSFSTNSAMRGMRHRIISIHGARNSAAAGMPYFSLSCRPRKEQKQNTQTMRPP